MANCTALQSVIKGTTSYCTSLVYRSVGCQRTW